MHTQMCACAHTHTYTYSHAHTHTHTHTHTLTHTHTHKDEPRNETQHLHGKNFSPFSIAVGTVLVFLHTGYIGWHHRLSTAL